MTTSFDSTALNAFEGNLAEYKPATETNKFPREIAERLLDKLSTDDAFRALFVSDARAAMASIGYETPEAYAGVPGSDPIMCCLNARLASKEVLAASRDAIATRLSGPVFHYDIGI